MKSEDVKKMGWELVGQCGVDSGSIMLIDPCYVLSDKDYDELTKIREKSGWNPPVEFKMGIVTPTYMGDGNYHTYIQKEKEGGRVQRILIDFTHTYGTDDDNKEMHDINMDELLEKVMDYQQKKRDKDE